MAGPILKDTIKKGVDLTKPIVSNILKKSSEIISKADGNPKKIDESSIVKDKSEVVVEQAEGASQAEGGNVIDNSGSSSINKIPKKF